MSDAPSTKGNRREKIWTQKVNDDIYTSHINLRNPANVVVRGRQENGNYRFTERTLKNIDNTVSRLASRARRQGNEQRARNIEAIGFRMRNTPQRTTLIAATPSYPGNGVRTQGFGRDYDGRRLWESGTRGEYRNFNTDMNAYNDILNGRRRNRR